MRVLGCAWKINFPEVIWSWLTKMRLWPQKWFETQIFTLNHFQVRHAKRERERERERESARKEREEAQITPLTSPVNPELQSDDRTHQISPIAPRHSISPSILPPFDLTSARSRLRPTNLRPTDLQPTNLSLWFWFLLLLWWCCSGVLVVVVAEICCRGSSLEFWWCVVLVFGCDFEIFYNKICLDAEKIAEKM